MAYRGCGLQSFGLLVQGVVRSFQLAALEEEFQEDAHLAQQDARRDRLAQEINRSCFVRPQVVGYVRLDGADEDNRKGSGVGFLPEL